MAKHRVPTIVVFSLATLLLPGCVERRLTINTEPSGAKVVLNDQEIGISPVTVSFNWYGDYWVRISKDGYETLDTHRRLKAPLHDRFPFDFFAQILYPGRIVDAYEWTFELAPKVYPTREELIESGRTLQNQLEP
ncbi:MAG: PEGA domain-containing protein [Planctomycetes bacterium]|nr:PEGA domain-containing protein [Planctomycetota bacterium]